MIDLAALRALAEKATPGLWHAMRDGAVVPFAHRNRRQGGADDDDLDRDYYAQTICVAWNDRHGRGDKRDNAGFVAAANPATILAILDRLAAAEQRAETQADTIERLERDLRLSSEERQRQHEETAALKARLGE